MSAHQRRKYSEGNGAGEPRWLDRPGWLDGGECEGGGADHLAERGGERRGRKNSANE